MILKFNDYYLIIALIITCVMIIKIKDLEMCVL